MTGKDERLFDRIDSALRPEPGADLQDLFVAVSQCLTSSESQEVRDAAGRVVAFSGATGLSTTEKEAFQTALLSFRTALESSGYSREEAADDLSNDLANDPELVQEFLIEAREHLSGVEAGILTLEREPGDAEALNAVFRSFHTIKGLAGFLGATAIHELAHETENALDLARSGHLALTPSTIDLILKSADALNKCLDAGRTIPLNRIPPGDRALLSAIAGLSIQNPTTTLNDPRLTDPHLDDPHLNDPREHVPVSGVPGTGVTEPEAPEPPPAGAQVSSAAKGASENSVVRIETSKLEYLIDMVGELVIAESVVRHDPVIGASPDPLLSRNLMQLARVVQEVQKTSMSMRMVSVGALFRKMNRLTRDLARKSGKTVELITVGDDVELDRSIVEDLADPMVHMVRNAVDHGLENPADRLASGKQAQGTICLRAMHDAGDIVIEISDDGRGMDPARILAKARRLGLVKEDETPDEETIFKLIFEPGFSTVDKVTDLSGRGVGMDVVKKQIQKLRGRIAIRSVLGKGCTFVLRLPLTLAIIDGLVVAVGTQRFILPMFAVREMFSPKPDTLVTLENRAEAALFRGKLLPVIRLSRLFAGSALPADSDASGSEAAKSEVLVVVDSREQPYCIAVDQLIGKQEVVIKSLGKTYRDVPAISGGAILGDGRVGLIVDVNSVRCQK